MEEPNNGLLSSRFLDDLMARYAVKPDTIVILRNTRRINNLENHRVQARKQIDTVQGRVFEFDL